jgi:hypothetical protein
MVTDKAESTERTTHFEEVEIQGNNIKFLSREFAEDDEKYAITYSCCEKICELLKIEIPNISISSDLGGGKLGYTFHRKDWKVLDKSLIQMIWNEDQFHYVGVLAHELRHVWQGVYAKQILGKRIDYARNGEEAGSNPAEIDADGFAVFYLHMISGKSIDECAEKFLDGMVCTIPYIRRVDRAEDISDMIQSGKSDREYIKKAVNYYKINPRRKEKAKQMIIRVCIYGFLAYGIYCWGKLTL